MVDKGRAFDPFGQARVALFVVTWNVDQFIVSSVDRAERVRNGQAGVFQRSGPYPLRLQLLDRVVTRPVQPEDPRVKYAWLLELGGLWVGLTHYVPVPERPPQFTLARWVERYFPDRTPDVIVSGDTHREIIAEVQGVLCVNPGSPTYPHNLNTQLGTIGFLDVEAGRAEASVWQLVDHGIEPFEWKNA